MTETVGYRISPQQARLWRIGGSSFACTAQVRLGGPVNSARLKNALSKVVEDHEILRTTFFVEPGLTTPNQRIHEQLIPAFHEIQVEADRFEARLDELLTTMGTTSLEQGPLLAATLVRRTAEDAVLLLRLPALCMDNAGMTNLVTALADAYHQRELEEEPPQYADMASWLHHLQEDEDAADARTFWTTAANTRADAPPLPFQERTADGAFDPGRVTCTIPTPAALGDNAHPDRLLLSLWNLLLTRLIDTREITMAVAFNGRQDESLIEAPGLLTRFLPVPAELDPRHSVHDLIQRLKRPFQLALEWENHYNWLTAPDEQGKHGKLPPFPFGFEYRAASQVKGCEPSFQVIRQNCILEPFKMKLDCTGGAQELTLTLYYDCRFFSPEAVEIMLHRYTTLLANACADLKAPIGGLDAVSAWERKRLTHDWNPTTPADLPALTVVQIFQALAAEHPDDIALIAGTTRLSYAQLDRRARALAAHLQSQGVGREDRVGIALDRNAHLITAMLGVMTAGAAYVPIDPKTPTDRIAWLQQDADLKLLITEQALLNTLVDAGLPAMILDDASYPQNVLPTPVNLYPENLAYIIYTSGSTGRPKGVSISHHALHHYAMGILNKLNVPQGSVFAGLATQAADLGYTATYGALLSGGTLQLLPEALSLDAHGLAEVLSQNPVDVLKVAPPHLKALLTGDNAVDLLPRAALVCGGDVLDHDLVQRVCALRPETRILNHYGPTETTVGVVAGLIGETAPEHNLPLGNPLTSSRVIITDHAGKLQMTGLPGELCIGGETLARAYQGQPALTAERFVPDPLSAVPGARVYRSGDLARFGATGHIHFLGRNDSQVKINGYRVELGEVETALRNHDGVNEAVVIVRGSNKQPAGYFTGTANAEALREHLSNTLPAYMVPAHLVSLHALPLNANGKIDRNALPDPTLSSTAYAAPENQMQSDLANIWAEVLDVPRVGIHDNFFGLGGDSIMTIQVIARARKLGMQLQPKQFFAHQTIAELAPHVVTQLIEADQSDLTGPVSSLPAGLRFATLVEVDPHHHNQSVMIQTPADLKDKKLVQALTALIKHHDMLRATFNDGVSIAETGPCTLHRIDLTHCSDANLSAELTKQVTKSQGVLNLKEGPLFRPVWFNLGPQRPGRLLLTAHHLVVDGVSWRILLEDLAQAYDAAKAGDAIDLPPKTTGVNVWADKLTAWARSPRNAGERQYWRDSIAEQATLPRDGATDDGNGTVGSEASITITLDAEETKTLLRQVPAAYNTQIDDALLTALALAVSRWSKQDSVCVELESHGREQLFDDVDLSRTVGWFTARYPVALTVSKADHAGTNLCAVKEQLRAVPNNGVGYGILRYLSPESELPAYQAPISFNYLGRVVGGHNTANTFQIAPEAVTAQKSPRQQRTNLLSILGIAPETGLQLTLTYSKTCHQRKSMEDLALYLKAALREIIDHCCRPEHRGYTPSDFTGVRIDQSRLNQLVADYGYDNLDAVARPSHIQHGMIFHSLEKPGQGVYIVQMAFDLTNLDVPAFQKAWDRVVDRFDIFRSMFTALDEAEPLLVTFKKVATPWTIEDWRDKDAATQETDFEKLRVDDRLRGFDLGIAPPARLALFQLSDNTHRFMWTYHHALSDGWSTPIVLRCLLQFYQEEHTGEKITDLAPAAPYHSYTRWLHAQDKDAAANFWRRYLQGYDEKLHLPMDKGSEYQSGQAVWLKQAAEDEVSKGLAEWARKEHLTTNLVAQTLWAVLLGYHCGTEDVTFGIVDSGRPPALPGSEDMVGPFLNSVPARLRYSRDDQLITLMKHAMELQGERSQHSHAPLVDIRRQCAVKGSLFDTLFQFQNYPVGEVVAESQRTMTLGIGNMKHNDDNHFVLTLIASMRVRFETQLVFRKSRVDQTKVETMLKGYHQMLATMIADPTQTVRDLYKLLDDIEKSNRNQQGKKLKSKSLNRLRNVKRKGVSI